MADDNDVEKLLKEVARLKLLTEEAKKKQEEAEKKLEQIQNVIKNFATGNFPDNLTTPISANNAEELIKFFDDIKIPLESNIYDLVREKIDPQLLNKFTRLENSTDETIAYMVIYFLNYEPTSSINSSSENIVAGAVDSLLGTMIQKFHVKAMQDFSVMFTRNVGGQAATGHTPSKVSQTNAILPGCRFDFLATNDRNVVLLGEEKSDKADDDPKKQILDENRFICSPLHFGTAPFVPVFTCTGSIFEFYAYLPRSAERKKPELKSIWGKMDITKVDGRIKLLICIIIILRTIRGHLENHYPTGVLHQSEKNIVVGKDYVEKKVPSKIVTKELRELYSLIQQHKPLSLVVGEIPNKLDAQGLLSIKLKPVGFQRPPQTIVELRIAIGCVLQALHWLHTEAKYVHRDLRWPNVLRVGGPPLSWMLIDYELCSKITTKLNGGEWPTEKVLAKEFQPPNNNNKLKTCWKPQHDLWQVFNILIKPYTEPPTRNFNHSIDETDRGNIQKWLDEMKDKELVKEVTVTF
jgi:hypothetical protein